MNKLLKNKLILSLNNKYQNTVFTTIEIIRRQKIGEEIKNKILKHKKFHECEICMYFKKEFKNKNKLIKFYKKFNSNLKLKKKYDKNLKKLSKRNSCIETLILLCEQIKNLTEINKVQKLNTFLKVNDIIIVKYLKNNQLPSTKFINNFNMEKKFIEKILCE